MRRFWPLRFLAIALCTLLLVASFSATAQQAQKAESRVLSPAAHSPVLAQSPETPREAFLSGQSRYEAGDYESALGLMQQAVAGFEQDGDPLQQAIALGNLSLIHQQLGQWPAATVAIDQSLSLLTPLQGETSAPLSASASPSPSAGPSSDPSLTLAAALDIQASLQLATGNTEAALATWERNEKIYQTREQLEGILRSRINQAQALRMLGFYRRARSRLEALKTQFDDAANLSSRPGRSDEYTQLQVHLQQLLGDALRLSGDLTASQESLEQGLALASQMQSPTLRRQQQSSLWLSLANTAQLQGQRQIALAHYQEAIALQPDESLLIQAYIGQLSLLMSPVISPASPSPPGQPSNPPTAQVVTAQVVTPQATSLLNQLLPRARSLSRDQPGLYSRLHLAQTLLNQDISTPGLRPYQGEVEDLLEASVVLAMQLGDRRSMSYAQGTLGTFYEQTGALNRAIELTQEAVRNAQAVNAADIGYRWNWQLGRLLTQTGQTAQAIDFYDDAIDDLNQLRSDLVAVNREIQFSFKESVEPVYRQSVGLLVQNQPSQSKAVTAKNLEKARERIEALQVAELDNFFREACLDGRSVVLDQVVDRDNPTTSIIYPILLEDRLEVVVKVPGQAELQHYTTFQPRTTVEQTLRELRESLELASRTQAVRQQAGVVYDWLIRPVEAALADSGVDTLVFVLDGALRNVPMGVLYDGEQYLVEKYGVGVSLGLQLLEPRAIAQTQLNVLAAGLVTPPASYRDRYQDLPFIKNEFEEIRNSGVSNRQLLNDEFTRDRLESEVRRENFNVVHLATHGEFSSDADRTFILAADGPIKVAELDTLLRDRSQANEAAIELLILSACATAEGDERAALGLAGVAVKAGARSTLASLWQADDESTATLMGAFYQQLTNTDLTKAQALRQAQLALLADRDLQAPAFWAPYILVGNWL